MTMKSKVHLSGRFRNSVTNQLCIYPGKCKISKVPRHKLAKFENYNYKESLKKLFYV